MALEEIKNLVDSGQYQAAYDAARMQGYDPNAISEFINKNYGTSYTGDTFAKDYEGQSQRNLREQGYGYATYDDGLGMGKAMKFGSPLAMSVGAVADPLAAAPDYKGMATTVGQGMGTGPRGNTYFTIPEKSNTGTAPTGAQTSSSADKSQFATNEDYYQYLRDKVFNPTWGKMDYSDPYYNEDRGGGRQDFGPQIQSLTEKDYAKMPAEFEKWQNRDPSIDPTWAWLFNQMNAYHEGRFAPGYKNAADTKYGGTSLNLAKDTIRQWLHDAEPSLLDKIANVAIPAGLSFAGGLALSGPIAAATGLSGVTSTGIGSGMTGGTLQSINSGQDWLKNILTGGAVGGVGGEIVNQLAPATGPLSELQKLLGKDTAKTVANLAKTIGTSTLQGKDIDFESLASSALMSDLSNRTGLPIATLINIMKSGK